MRTRRNDECIELDDGQVRSNLCWNKGPKLTVKESSRVMGGNLVGLNALGKAGGAM